MGARSLRLGLLLEESLVVLASPPVPGGLQQEE